MEDRYVRYRAMPSLDKIVFIGFKRSLAKFIAYLLKSIRMYDELYKMIVEKMMPIDYELFYETYSSLDE